MFEQRHIKLTIDNEKTKQAVNAVRNLQKHTTKAREMDSNEMI